MIEGLVQFSCSVVSDSLRPHGLQQARIPCPSPTPRACSNSYSWSQWCHPTISSSITPFSSCLRSFPVSGSFPMSQFFASGGWSIGVSALAASRLLSDGARNPDCVVLKSIFVSLQWSLFLLFTVVFHFYFEIVKNSQTFVQIVHGVPWAPVLPFPMVTCCTRY